MLQPSPQRRLQPGKGCAVLLVAVTAVGGCVGWEQGSDGGQCLEAFFEVGDVPGKTLLEVAARPRHAVLRLVREALGGDTRGKAFME